MQRKKQRKAELQLPDDYGVHDSDVGALPWRLASHCIAACFARNQALHDLRAHSEIPLCQEDGRHHASRLVWAAYVPLSILSSFDRIRTSCGVPAEEPEAHEVVTDTAVFDTLGGTATVTTAALDFDPDEDAARAQHSSASEASSSGAGGSQGDGDGDDVAEEAMFPGSASDEVRGRGRGEGRARSQCACMVVLAQRGHAHLFPGVY